METIITARHFELTDELRSHVESEMERLRNHSRKLHRAHVILEIEPHGNRQIAEINLHANSTQYVAKSESHDMYVSIDEVLEKLKRQLEKHRDKVIDHRHRGAHTTKDLKEEYAPEMYDYSEYDTDLPEIVEVEYDLQKPMSIEEAALQLKMSPNLFLVFMNAKTGRLNVIFRRKDNTFGLIQPQRH
ncbi:MAG: ribosome-associated translation inhibitor RaiA [Gemmatimonadetes bacterium]|nr:MAG: ribosome-associated translation inhibitor RaiA [Gemmatimonadota bacterium]